MKNPRHPVFRPAVPSDDSCIVAAQNANERYLRRQRSAEEYDTKQERETYVATHNDLPEVFWGGKGASGA
jgi:hypothetical protein